MRPAAQAHYLRPNDKVWTPPAVVFLDSETRTREVSDLELLELRLWVAKLVDRRNQRKRTPPEQWAWGDDPGSLADQLTAWSVGRKTLWVYAHNLGFDLVTTALPVVMARAGWKVTDFALRSQSPWLRLSDGKGTITVCDSWSWVQAALEDVARAYGRSKEPLPGEHDPAAVWLTRCRTDVDLLAQGMCDLMDWWDRHRLGRWTISGAAAGWNAMRHRGSAYRILVDPDPDVLAADREAIRGGRRDTQRAGDLGRGDFVELDLVSAYPTVAAHLPLPYRRGGVFDSLPVDHRAVADDRWGFVADVVVRTERPRYPMRHRGVTWYPVGTFRTTLASPEVAWARENGDLVSIGAGRFHQLGYALADWAEWVLRVASGEEPDTPPVARMAARGWGRSVIGKFASRGQAKTALGSSESTGWGYLEGWDHDAGRHGALVDMCGQRWWAVYDTEGENTYPAVLAFVESHVRARLGRVLDALPEGAWVTCDTDGLILDATATHHWAWQHSDRRARPRKGWAVASEVARICAPQVAPLVLRPKREYETLRLIGPQHVVWDDGHKLSGVRRDATETAPWAFKSRDWPSMRWQMAHSTPGAYARPAREVKLRRPLVHRWLTDDGECWPVWARLGDDGTNQLVPWGESWGPHTTSPLAKLQYPGLDGLY